MTRPTLLRATFGLMIIVLGNLQAWDSNVHEAGLGTVLLVSLAIALAAVVLLLPLQQTVLLSALILSFALLVVARLTSPVLVPGLFLILVPAVMGLIFTGVVAEKQDH
jgi:hypothetical protein